MDNTDSMQEPGVLETDQVLVRTMTEDDLDAVTGQELVIGNPPFDVNRQLDGAATSHLRPSGIHSPHYNSPIVAVQLRNE